MTRQILFTPQRATETDVTANAAPAATAAFFISGTTTPIDIEDVDGDPMANPLTADGAGAFPQVVYTGNEQVKCVLRDSSGATLYTIDPCPLFDAAGSAASAVSYEPSAYLPETNVQAALDEIALILQGQSSPMGLSDGTASSPALFFHLDGNCGLYRVGEDILGIAGAVSISGNGTAGDPGLFWRTGVSAAGFFSPLAGTLGIATGDVERGRVTAAGALIWGQGGASEAQPGVGNSTYGLSMRSGGVLHVSREAGVGLTVNRSDDGSAVAFYRAGDVTPVGSISVSAGATAYNTSSDVRLKENVEPADDPGAVIDAIGIKKYDFIGGGHIRWGLIAQDEINNIPEVIKRGDDGEEITDPWGGDWSKMVPMLVKEIQNLRARVAALEV